MTTMRSPSVMASTWSWVTKTEVVRHALTQLLELERASARAAGRRGWTAARRTGTPAGCARCAPERDALLLAARELARPAVEQRLDAGSWRRCARRPRSRPRRPPVAQAERQVVVHAHVLIERVVLEHHGDVAVFRLQVVDDAVADGDVPPVMSSSPAIMRSVVDLPQPDGPTSTTNSWSAICRLKSLTATTAP